MLRNRRLACLALGIWLGAAVAVDVLVTRNFSTVDRFLADPGSPAAVYQISQAKPQNVRFLLRRSAAEENAWIFENWEWAQIFIALVFFLLIFFGERPPKLALGLTLAMLLLVLAQRFAITPQVISLGREIADVAPADLAASPANTRFWTFHGVYSGMEILKLLLGLGLGVRLMNRREDRNRFADDYSMAMGTDTVKRKHG
jgi:hypothetical protein